MRKSITGNACLSNTRRGKLKSLTTKYSNLLSFVQLCSLLSHKSHGESAVYALTNNLYLLLFFIGHILLVKLWPADGWSCAMSQFSEKYQQYVGHEELA